MSMLRADVIGWMGRETYGHAHEGLLIFDSGTHFCGLSKNKLDKFAEGGLRGDVFYESEETGDVENGNRMEVFKRRGGRQKFE